MPKYEIGYILSSAISDDEVANVTAQVSKNLQGLGANILNEDHWGRKKLAYPIGRTRNGYYAFITLDVEPSKVADIEHSLNTNDAIIRFLVVNMTDADKRKAKDAAANANRVRPSSSIPTTSPESETEKVDLDQEIEKAIIADQERV